MKSTEDIPVATLLTAAERAEADAALATIGRLGTVARMRTCRGLPSRPNPVAARMWLALAVVAGHGAAAERATARRVLARLFPKILQAAGDVRQPFDLRLRLGMLALEVQRWHPSPCAGSDGPAAV